MSLSPQPLNGPGKTPRHTAPLTTGTAPLAPPPAEKPQPRMQADKHVGTGQLAQPAGSEIADYPLPQAKPHGRPRREVDSPVAQSKAVADAVKLPFDINEFHGMAREHVVKKELRTALLDQRAASKTVRQAQGKIVKVKPQMEGTHEQLLTRLRQGKGAKQQVNNFRNELHAAKQELKGLASRGASKPELAQAQARVERLAGGLDKAKQDLAAVTAGRQQAGQAYGASRRTVKSAESGLKSAQAQKESAAGRVGQLKHELAEEAQAKTLTGWAKNMKVAGGMVTAGAGVVGVFVGIDEYRQGQHERSVTLKAGGVLDVGSGVATTATGVASTMETLGVAASSAGTVAKFAGAVAVPLTGAASVLTGGYQGYSKGRELPAKEKALAAVKANPRHTLAQVKEAQAAVDKTRLERNTGWIKSAGGGLMLAGSGLDCTVVGAAVGVPLQIVGGVMVAGACVYESWDKIVPAAKEGAAYIGHAASQASHEFHALTGW